MPIKLNNQLTIQRRFKLADTLPKQTETSTIGLLIGSDYYNELISPERVEIQKGLYAIKSKFGWIISGKTKTEGPGVGSGETGVSDTFFRVAD